MLSQLSSKEKRLRFFHVNESHRLHLSTRHTYKANPPTHKHTQRLRYRKSKHELVEAATKAKTNPPTTFVGWG